MESPPTSTTNRYRVLAWSALIMLWWIGIWGIADTLIHFAFKGNKMKELLVYVTFIVIVILAVYLKADLIEKF